MANDTSTHSTATIPADDASRYLGFAAPNTDESLIHVCVAGDTYTMLLTGKDTNGKYCLIDMYVPPGGGPPLHRHDFEEMFTILEGEAEFTFRGAKRVVRAGESVNIPANAPHHFTNASAHPIRMLCMCTPAGQDEFFVEVGDRVPTRTSSLTEKSDAERSASMQKTLALAAKYKTELLA